MEGGPPSFRQDFSCPTVLRNASHGASSISCTGLSPPLVALPSSFPLYSRFLTPRPVLHPAQMRPTTPALQQCKPYTARVWALPRSLAATQGISPPRRGTAFDFFSSRYLDGSVPWVSPPCPMCSDRCDRYSQPAGLPHSATPGSLDVCSSPGFFAAYHGLLRQIAPRHPP